MPRFITVTVGCDWNACTVEAPETDDLIVTKTVALDGKTPKQFLLCKQHLEDFEELVLPLMQAGVKVESPSPRKSPSKPSSPSPAPGPVQERNSHDKIDCKVDGCERKGDRGLSNRTGMAQHAIRTHDYPDLATYEAEFGAVA